MTFKALLLGSAAALATAGGAQAADLMAESVDYVRICDAFGSGYYYIPGGDTCLKIGGYVQFNARAGEDQGKSGDSGSRFGTTTELRVTAAKMTSHGPLIGYMALKGDYTGSSDNEYSLDEGYIQWGHLLMGKTDSLTKLGGGGNWQGDEFKPNSAPNLIATTWSHGGHALSFALEDSHSGANESTGSGEMPALTANITGEIGHVDYGLAAGWVQGSTLDDGFAVTGFASWGLEFLHPRDTMSVWFGYGEDAAGPYFLGDGNAVAANGSHFVWGVNFRHYWSDDWRTGITYSAYDGNGSGSDFGANLVYIGVSGLQIGPGIRILDNVNSPSVTTFHFRAQFDF